MTDTTIQHGKKFDSGKPDLSILSRNGVEGIAQAFQFGMEKYGRYNYLEGMKWTRIISAALRHLYAFAWGEDIDKESGLHHLYHAGACVFMLIDYAVLSKGQDDRYKIPQSSTTTTTITIVNTTQFNPDTPTTNTTELKEVK